MDDVLVARAIDAVTAAAAAMDLDSSQVRIIQNSTKLSLGLQPCDVFARVAPIGQVGQLAREVELAQQLTAVGAPVVALDPRMEPRVYQLDGFAVTWWTFHDTRHDTTHNGDLTRSEYATALAHIHAGMRTIAVETPHFHDRVAEAEDLVTNPDQTPALDSGGRELLVATLTTCRESISRSAAVEQLLHGEPHPGNILNTSIGPLFIDLETACRGPVEFDLAHVPRAVCSAGLWLMPSWLGVKIMAVGQTRASIWAS